MSEGDERHQQDEFMREDEPDVEGHIQDVATEREAQDVATEREAQDVASERHRVDEHI